MTPPNAKGTFILDATRFGAMEVKWGRRPLIAGMGFDPMLMGANKVLGFGIFAGIPGFILQGAMGPPVRVRTKVTVAMAPCWALIAIFAVIPAIWSFARWRDGARRDGGLCEICGYDLRATPERCPECGTVPGKKASP